jgi:hypothetical protein
MSGTCSLFSASSVLNNDQSVPIAIKYAFYIVIVLLALLPVFCQAEDPQLPGLGMWSWGQSSFSTPAARKTMLDFCAREGISHIDQHISIKRRGDTGEIQNQEALKALLAEAAKQKISINALRGDKAMFFAANHGRTMTDLDALIAFNNQLPKHARFAGIKYDVEPYLTPQWKAGDEQQNTVMTDYLGFLEKANAKLDKKAPGLALCVDVPFWWDKPKYSLVYKGKDQGLVHHIQDRTDWIGIMSYRRDAKEVLKLVKTEVEYAEKIKKHRSVAPGLETIQLKGKEQRITFWGTPPETFRKTLAEIRQELASSPEVRVIMLHHYRSLVKYLETAPDKH